MGAFEIAQKKAEAKSLRRKQQAAELAAAAAAEDEDDDESADDDVSLVLDGSDGSTEPSDAGVETDEEAAEDEGASDVDSGDENETETPAAPVKKGNKAPPPAASATQLEINEPAQWVERMALTSTRSLPADLNADDDPKREEAFIQQTLLSVSRGLSMLEAAGVPWRRPEDYYAEMYKSDTHMNDVRQAMEASKSRIEAQAHRRAMKDQKKYGKEVQAEVLRQRAKYKRDMQDRISDWQRKKKGNGALRDFLEGDEDAGRPAKRGRPEPRQKSTRPGGKQQKRPGKNARSRR